MDADLGGSSQDEDMDDEIDDDLGDESDLDSLGGLRDAKTASGRKAAFGIVEYFEGILWNIQMYVDGFVPDYRYVYPFRYAPDARRIVRWIEASNFDPDPGPVLPVSTASPLTPVQACVSMMPLGAGKYLPEPLRYLVDAPDSPLAEMLGENGIDLDVALLVKEVESAELSSLSPEQQAAICPNEAWTVFSRAPDDLDGERRTLSDYVRSIVPTTHHQRILDSTVLRTKDMPPPPSDGKFRKVTVDKAGLVQASVLAQDFPPCRPWPTLEVLKS
ncbi:hypothetical protein T484DRAFT_3584808 [Baffinella frigidus]|nr:hypothetical protein T484DRAFT_3584808 [Cryptophyta sp. CCMP2293]